MGEQNKEIYSNKVTLALVIVRKNCWTRCFRWVEERKDNLQNYVFTVENRNNKEIITEKFRKVDASPDFFFRKELMNCKSDEEFEFLVQEAGYNGVVFSEDELKIIKKLSL